MSIFNSLFMIPHYQPLHQIVNLPSPKIEKFIWKIQKL